MNGDLYVVWEDARSGSEHIYFASSIDGGVSFGQNKRVDDTPRSGSRQLNPVIALGNDDEIYVAWQDNRRYVYDFDIYFAYSNDGGKSFSANIKVDDSLTNPVSWQEQPSIAVDSKGNIAIAWTDDRTGILRTREAISTDEGLTFSPSAEVTSDSSGIHGQTSASLRYSGTQLFAAFIDNCTGLPHPYLVRSSDNGRSFSQPIRLDGATNARQRSVSLDALGDGVIAVWEDARGGDWDVYGATISGTGVITSSAFRISDGGLGTNQVNPSIGVDPTGMYVAWEDDRNSRYAVRLTYALLGTTTFATSVEVASPTHDQLQSMPSTAATGNRGGFFVVWEDSGVTLDQVLEARGYVPGQAAPWIWALGTKTSLPGVAVSFQATAYDPDSPTLRYTWDFGDGTRKIMGNPVNHTYSTSGEYSFTVYVDDLAVTPGHNVSTVGLAMIGYNLNLVEGWSLVTLPLIGTSYRASTLGLSTGDIVVSWNSTTQIFDKTYIVGMSPPIIDYAIVPGKGYWIYSTSPKSVLLGGSPATTTQRMTLSVPSKGGWVTIGLVSVSSDWNASDLAGAIVCQNGGRVATVCSWNPVTSAYSTYVPGHPLNDFALAPGEACFVSITGTATLTYNP